MHKTSKIYIAGHNGLVGSAIVHRLRLGGYINILTATRAELDLTNQAAVADFFNEHRPDYVFLAAAKVGGIVANNNYPAEFIYSNLSIQLNVIHESWKAGVKRLLFLGSSCIYPRECPQPIREDYLLTGTLELTNRPYAVAKIAGIDMCWAYNRQYGTHYLAAMPTNLYGVNDHYDLQNSHVLPALIRKIHEAKETSEPTVMVWGTGSPRREFLYSADAADACVYLMELPEEGYKGLFNETAPPLVNIGCGEDQTIKQLAEMVMEVVGYSGKLVFDQTKPDGTPRKLLDVSRLNSLGWKAQTGLKQGIGRAYEDFLARL